MNKTNIKKTVKAFHVWEEAQTNYELLFETLSEEEEAEFERQLFQEGITITKKPCSSLSELKTTGENKDASSSK